ncbi:hypothetical protein ABZ746_24915 [Streptomyces sp. NPDC020096]
MRSRRAPRYHRIVVVIAETGSPSQAALMLLAQVTDRATRQTGHDAMPTPSAAVRTGTGTN